MEGSSSNGVLVAMKHNEHLEINSLNYINNSFLCHILAWTKLMILKDIWTELGKKKLNKRFICFWNHKRFSLGFQYIFVKKIKKSNRFWI